mmetsp:Transcript_90496/g.156856  ORF Transcript_90496/g.156856 Transcript_90496/m.156856 type:complete len:265 (+) Transcript_90496:1620-2414(+)
MEPASSSFQQAVSCCSLSSSAPHLASASRSRLVTTFAWSSFIAHSLDSRECSALSARSLVASRRVWSCFSSALETSSSRPELLRAAAAARDSFSRTSFDARNSMTSDVSFDREATYSCSSMFTAAEAAEDFVFTPSNAVCSSTTSVVICRLLAREAAHSCSRCLRADADAQDWLSMPSCAVRNSVTSTTSSCSSSFEAWHSSLHAAACREDSLLMACSSTCSAPISATSLLSTSLKCCCAVQISPSALITAEASTCSNIRLPNS